MDIYIYYTAFLVIICLTFSLTLTGAFKGVWVCHMFIASRAKAFFGALLAQKNDMTNRDKYEDYIKHQKTFRPEKRFLLDTKT